MIEGLRKLLGLEQKVTPVADRTPETIQVGDAIEIMGENYTVQQRIEYRGDGGDIWWDYLVQTPQGRRWLGVVDDDGLELTVYDEVKFYPDMPPPTKLEYDGKTFHRTEHGFADAYITRRSGVVPGRVEYWDYEAEDGTLLSIERWGRNEIREDQAQMTGSIDVSVGQRIKPYHLKIYPGEAPVPR